MKIENEDSLLHARVVVKTSNLVELVFKRFSGHFPSENTLSNNDKKFIYKAFFVVLRGPVL